MKEIELKDLQEQLDPMRDLVGDLTASLSKIANRQCMRRRHGPKGTPARQDHRAVRRVWLPCPRYAAL
jgi:hypothetical protein